MRGLLIFAFGLRSDGKMDSMKRFLLALAGTVGCMFVLACGGPEKPPLTPDGPLETMPVGEDAGAMATPTASTASAAPAAPTTPAPAGVKK